MVVFVEDPITLPQMMSKGCIITSLERYSGSMLPFSVSVIGSLGVNTAIYLLRPYIIYIYICLGGISDVAFGKKGKMVLSNHSRVALRIPMGPVHRGDSSIPPF